MIPTENENCVGCGSCMKICPKGAIDFHSGEEGFLYPFIKDNKCVACNLCKKYCPANQAYLQRKPLAVYAARLDDNDILLKSASGGVFYALARDVIAYGGIVFGAYLDKEDEFTVHHISVENFTDLNKLQGSKYVESMLGNSYQEIRDFLDKGRLVLFSGTPCQVAGLRMYLRANAVENVQKLLTVEVLCHGVASRKLFAKYISWLSRKRRLIDYDFRTNYHGWYSCGGIIAFISYAHESVNARRYYRASVDPYMYHYLHANANRESCYNCRFKIANSYADISLGDFVDVYRLAPEMYTPLGLNSVYINTECGREAFEHLNTIRKELEFDMIRQRVLTANEKRTKVREQIYRRIDELDSKAFVQKELLQRIPKKEYLKILLPHQVKTALKRILR
jgi:coenzyme F420-reducing hydrogenase beta subunit